MLETLLEEIAERGWLVSNLFQRDDGTWQANLRTPTHHTDYGKGPTPVLALSLAIEAIESAEESHETVVSSHQGTPPWDTVQHNAKALFADILANLRKPTQVHFRGKL